MISSKLKNASSNWSGSWAILCEVVEARTQREPLILIARLFSDDRIISFISSLQILHSTKIYRNFRSGLFEFFIQSNSIIEKDQTMTSSLWHLAKNSCRACSQQLTGRYLFKLKVEVAEIGARVGEGDQRVLLSAVNDPLIHSNIWLTRAKNCSGKLGRIAKISFL
jgi:hypothetical protein